MNEIVKELTAHADYECTPFYNEISSFITLYCSYSDNLSAVKDEMLKHLNAARWSMYYNTEKMQEDLVKVKTLIQKIKEL